jgi:hypothetical protein
VKPRSIKVVQTNRTTGQQRRAELCQRYLMFISDFTKRTKTPGEVLDAMLWGDVIVTERFTYQLETN